MAILPLRHRLQTSGVDLALLEDCPPDWLIPVKDIDHVKEADYNHAWIDQEERVFILNFSGDGFVRIDNNDVWESIEHIEQLIVEVRDDLTTAEGDISRLQEKYKEQDIRLDGVDDALINLGLDMSNKADKVPLAEEGNLTILDIDGQYQDSGVGITDLATGVELKEYQKKSPTDDVLYGLKNGDLQEIEIDIDGINLEAYQKKSPTDDVLYGLKNGDLQEIEIDIDGINLEAYQKKSPNDNVLYGLKNGDLEEIEIDLDAINLEEYQKKSPTDGKLYALKDGDIQEIKVSESEHSEVIFNTATGDAPLLGGTSVKLDFKKYKKLRIYTLTGWSMGHFSTATELDLVTATTVQFQKLGYATGYSTSSYVNPAVLFSGFFTVFDTKDELIFDANMVNIRDNTVTDLARDANHFVYKIEGVYVEASTVKRVANGDEFDSLYPVGIVIEFAENVDPNVSLGGVWRRFGNGAVTVGLDTTQTEFNALRRTGGTKAQSLSVANIPAHVHQIRRGWGQSTIASNADRIMMQTDFSLEFPTQVATSMNTTSVGNGEAHNNLQPYVTVVRWERIG